MARRLQQPCSNSTKTTQEADMSATTLDLANVSAESPKVSRETRFNQLIGIYKDDLFRFAYWLSGDRAVADDLVQETLVRAWKSFDKLNDSQAAKGWLMTIVRRENARRFERKRPQESEMPPEEIAATRSDYDTSTEAFALRRALEKLPLDYREPLLMQVIHGYSQKEIATHLGISVAGAGTRLFRAREKMREILQD
jgi:RNA polymerase sigma-70 factor (ECF subfamily)